MDLGTARRKEIHERLELRTIARKERRARRGSERSTRWSKPSSSERGIHDMRRRQFVGESQTTSDVHSVVEHSRKPLALRLSRSTVFILMPDAGKPRSTSGRGVCAAGERSRDRRRSPLEAELSTQGTASLPTHGSPEQRRSRSRSAVAANGSGRRRAANSLRQTRSPCWICRKRRIPD